MVYHQRFKTMEQRFQEKYIVRDTGCWEWKTGKVHPRFWLGGSYQKASRYVFEQTHNVRLTPEQHVCHTCDNSICVNPGHLFLGDHHINMRDKATKKRSHRPSGELNGRAKITFTVAQEIRELYATGSFSKAALGRRFGLSDVSVIDIVKGKSWKTLTGR